MANHDLMLGQSHNSGIGQNKLFMHNHHDSGLSLTQHHDHHDIGLSQMQEHDHHENHDDSGLSQTQHHDHHDIGLSQTQEHDHHENHHDICLSQTPEHDHRDIGLSHTQQHDHHDIGLSQTPEHDHRDIGLSHTHQHDHHDIGPSQTPERDHRDIGLSYIHQHDHHENHHDIGLSQTPEHHHHGIGLSHTQQHDQHENHHDIGLSQTPEHDHHDIGLSHTQQHDHHDIGLCQTHHIPGQAQEHDHHDIGLNQNQEHCQNLSQTLEHDLDHGERHAHDLHSEHPHEHEVGLEQSHNHEGNEHFCEQGNNDEKPNHEHEDPQLPILQNYELSLVESENQEFDENVVVTVEQGEDMGFGLVDVMEVEDPMYVVETPHIVQPRAVVASPSHEVLVGQEFPDVISCRRALRDCAIALHFEIQTIKSDKTRFTAKCASEGCPWRVHAAKLPGVPTFTIRTLHDIHTCGGIGHLGHQQASVEWVAQSVEERLKENPNIKPKEILEEIHRLYGITLTYKQAWRGKERIMATMRGSFEEGYRLLPEYCEQVQRTNPGSIASVYGNPDDNSFQRLFISFQASIYGFVNGCCPLLGLDRVQLKSKYLGSLLLATAFDGDGAFFPLAFGVVNEENDDNWMWFLSELHRLLEINTENMPRLTILSDRGKGITDGVEANFPTAFHGFCMRHLSEMFHKEFNNTMLVNILWEAAYALTTIEFESKILEIEELSMDAALWIRRVPPRLWATAYFECTRFGHLTVNELNSLDNWLHEASGLPIVLMMEWIRRQLMTWFNERREISMQWTSILVPNPERRVAEAIDEAHSYQVHANEADFEVTSLEGTNLVDIRNRCCQCRGWQLYGLPCAHAVAALLSCRQNVHRFTESCFTVATYRKTYSQTIHPIPDKTTWKELADLKPVIEPPKSLRPPGRMRKKRVRAEDRGRIKRVVHCSLCNQTGHFRTTCATPI